MVSARCPEGGDFAAEHPRERPTALHARLPRQEQRFQFVVTVKKRQIHQSARIDDDHDPGKLRIGEEFQNRLLVLRKAVIAGDVAAVGPFSRVAADYQQRRVVALGGGGIIFHFGSGANPFEGFGKTLKYCVADRIPTGVCHIVGALQLCGGFFCRRVNGKRQLFAIHFFQIGRQFARRFAVSLRIFFKFILQYGRRRMKRRCDFFQQSRQIDCIRNRPRKFVTIYQPKQQVIHFLGINRILPLLPDR